MSNKKLLILTLLLNFIIAVFFMLGITSVTNFNYKITITENDFVSKMNEIGCDIDYIYDESLIMLKTKNCPYFIEYTTFYSNDIQNKYINERKKNVVNNNSNIVGTTNINIYNKYIELSTTGDNFNIMTKNKNTILVASATTNYRDNLIKIFDDFNYHFSINYDGIIILFITFIFIVVFISFCFYKIKNKIGNNCKIWLIPIINFFELIKDVYGSYLYTFLLFVPIINIIIFFGFFYKLGKLFGKNILFSFLLVIFPTILIPVISFDDSIFQPKKSNNKNDNSVSAKKSILENIIILFRCFFSVLLIFIGLIFLLIFIDENKYGYLSLFFISLFYSSLFLPVSHIQKFNKTNRIILFIIGLIITLVCFAVFEF